MSFLIWCINRTRDIRIFRFIGGIAKEIFSTKGVEREETPEQCCDEGSKPVDEKKRDSFIKVWKSCERDTQSDALTFTQKLRVGGFVITTLLGIFFNYGIALYVEGDQNVYLLSTIVTILVLEIGLLILNFQVTPQDSPIYYYDETRKKNIFIYFRHDDNHYIGGDKEVWSSCTESFLIPYERIETQTLYLTSKLKQNRTTIDNKKNCLQCGSNELMLNDTYDKVNKELKSHGVGSALLKTADIYIRIDERKAYYVLADGTRGDIDL